jgi:hypothetical protein
MAVSTLEERLAAVESELANIRSQLASGPVSTKSILSIAGSMSNFPEFDELMEHSKYVRRTGQLPPPDWRPGDPIPEPEQ